MRVQFFTVLQRDLAMQLLVKQYAARNSPGPQDFSLAQEWHLFLVVLFTLLGYDINKLEIIQQNNNDHKTELNWTPNSRIKETKNQLFRN